ncbi:hypothetical protein ABPG75_008414 [Micractinium tetrahymenae]
MHSLAPTQLPCSSFPLQAMLTTRKGGKRFAFYDLKLTLAWEAAPASSADGQAEAEAEAAAGAEEEDGVEKSSGGGGSGGQAPVSGEMTVAEFGSGSDHDDIEVSVTASGECASSWDLLDLLCSPSLFLLFANLARPRPAQRWADVLGTPLASLENLPASVWDSGSAPGPPGREVLARAAGGLLQPRASSNLLLCCRLVAALLTLASPAAATSCIQRLSAVPSRSGLTCSCLSPPPVLPCRRQHQQCREGGRQEAGAAGAVAAGTAAA